MSACRGYAVCQFETIGTNPLGLAKWNADVSGTTIGDKLEGIY